MTVIRLNEIYNEAFNFYTMSRLVISWTYSSFSVIPILKTSKAASCYVVTAAYEDLTKSKEPEKS